MSIEYICARVAQVQEKYGEAEPRRLCSAMKILLLHEPMGTSPGACKGFYLRQSGRDVITVNSDLPEELGRIILAHELGHAVLHKAASGMNAFHDFALFDSTSQYEYEANVFAAQCLMSDEDVLGLLNDDMSFFAAAASLNVPPELLDFKFRLLKRQGYKIIDPPLMARSDFLKKI